ncbi:hypothetical protein K3217_14275 [bacterium BD-1]|nr:hypothetical protein [Ottowia caeni]
MGDENDEKATRIANFLTSLGPPPSEEGRPPIYERIGEWKVLPNGIFVREVTVNSECVRLEFATRSEAEAIALARALESVPDELSIALSDLRRLEDEIETEVRSSQTVSGEVVAKYIALTNQVIRLFERSRRSQEAANRFEEWEKRSKSGRAKAEKSPVSPEKHIALDLKRNNPRLSAVQIKTRGKLRASERTIRNWIRGVC